MTLLGFEPATFPLVAQCPNPTASPHTPQVAVDVRDIDMAGSLALASQ